MGLLFALLMGAKTPIYRAAGSIRQSKQPSQRPELVRDQAAASPRRKQRLRRIAMVRQTSADQLRGTSGRG